MEVTSQIKKFTYGRNPTGIRKLREYEIVTANPREQIGSLQFL